MRRYGAVDEDVGRNWCKRMCQALRYCHKKGVAHRDLKCDNLLLDQDLQVKIGDFGFCCRSMDPRTGSPIFSDTYCGSSSYVAPEVIESQPYDPIAADIWSAGVCIYVILNNAMPFDDSNLTRMHEDQINRKWDFSPNVKKNLSSSAKNLVARMMEPVPSKRPSMDQNIRFVSKNLSFLSRTTKKHAVGHLSFSVFHSCGLFLYCPDDCLRFHRMDSKSFHSSQVNSLPLFDQHQHRLLFRLLRFPLCFGRATWNLL
ncbi:hypothetical protein NPIL_171631 [Nephila pilipes]|uniref:Protein kinase domain-containing protein n=1 Tax=Nephila pilipes TaxID=299642 RepID=A0A8X6MXP1_NEPPI|nr:hypothetical protein NPIL_171631 [Nephila pilipes]